MPRSAHAGAHRLRGSTQIPFSIYYTPNTWYHKPEHYEVKLVAYVSKMSARDSIHTCRLNGFESIDPITSIFRTVPDTSASAVDRAIHDALVPLVGGEFLGRGVVLQAIAEARTYL